MVKAVVGDDCGCEERREKLNKMFPYAQPMNEASVKVMEEKLIPAYQRNRFKAKEQHAMIHVYQQVFGVRRDFSTCGACILEAYKKLVKAYEQACVE